MQAELRQILELARNGDRTAFDELVKLCQHDLMAFFGSRTRHVQDAEEMTQETLVEMYKSLPTLRDLDAFYGWMYAIARRVVSHRPHKKSFVSVLAQASRRESIASGGMSMDELLAELNDKERWLLTMRYGQGLSPVEIALRLGDSHDAVRARLSRLIRSLRQRFQ